MDDASYRALLQLDMENTAIWRRRVAEEHPEDKRNAEAASILDQLAASVDAIPDELISLYGLMWGEDGNENLRHSERLTEELRMVGFSSSPRDATEFVESFTGID